MYARTSHAPERTRGHQRMRVLISGRVESGFARKMRKNREIVKMGIDQIAEMGETSNIKSAMRLICTRKFESTHHFTEKEN